MFGRKVSLLTGIVAVLSMVFGVFGAASSADKVVWNFNVWGGKRAFTKGVEILKQEL